jgi:hypothetical protein
LVILVLEDAIAYPVLLLMSKWIKSSLAYFPHLSNRIESKGTAQTDDSQSGWATQDEDHGRDCGNRLASPPEVSAVSGMRRALSSPADQAYSRAMRFWGGGKALETLTFVDSSE